MNYIEAVLAAYIITVVITGSSLFARLRRIIITHTPWLQPDPDYPHFIVCRLCVGGWVSLAMALFFGLGFGGFLLVYGGSYFMATQEL